MEVQRYSTRNYQTCDYSTKGLIFLTCKTVLAEIKKVLSWLLHINKTPDTIKIITNNYWASVERGFFSS